MMPTSLPLTDQEAHEIAMSIRGTEFPPEPVDRKLLQGITEPLLAIADVPRAAKARAAAGAVAIIRKGGDDMLWRGQRVNPETMAAIFDVLSDGKYRTGCPDSPDRYHIWAAADINPTGSSPVRIPLKNRRCQRCGLQG
jgi:hypothetical protein